MLSAAPGATISESMSTATSRHVRQQMAQDPHRGAARQTEHQDRARRARRPQQGSRREVVPGEAGQIALLVPPGVDRPGDAELALARSSTPRPAGRRYRRRCGSGGAWFDSRACGSGLEAKTGGFRRSARLLVVMPPPDQLPTDFVRGPRTGGHHLIDPGRQLLRLLRILLAQAAAGSGGMDLLVAERHVLAVGPPSGSRSHCPLSPSIPSREIR